MMRPEKLILSSVWAVCHPAGDPVFQAGKAGTLCDIRGHRRGEDDDF